MSTEPAKNWSFRRRLIGKLLKIFFGRPPQRPKLKPEDVSRVLLFRHDRLGDYIVTTPVVEAIRRHVPNAKIDVLVSSVNAEFIRRDPRINEVLVMGTSLFQRLKVIQECRRRDYDLTLQLITRHTTAPAILASLCTPSGRVVGRGHSYNNGLFDHQARRTDDHMAEQTFYIFADALDFGEEEITMPPYSIHVPPEIEASTVAMLKEKGLEEKKYLLLNLSASESYRALGAKKSIEMAQKLRAIYEPKGIKIALMAAPDDSDKMEEVSKESGATMLRFPSILGVAAGIRHACTVISPDTGPVHIASAVDTPVVAYYAEHGKPSKWRPLGVPNRVILTKVDYSGEDVDVDEVIAATKEIAGTEL